MIKTNFWIKALLSILFINIAISVEVEEILKRLEDPNDDLQNLDSEISEILLEISSNYEKSGDGLENAIADFFTYEVTLDEDFNLE